MIHLPDLPVRETFISLKQVLRDSGMAVLVAPPGAGKTTLVPLMMLQEGLIGGGRILIVEPRRIAARAAARRMANLLGEQVGRTVGHAVRFDTVSSEHTRILAVTDGVFVRMALNDPALEGVDAVLFDEFHERSLDMDFALALTLDIREALRPDLKLTVMSATLDAVPVAGLMGSVPIIESHGRSWPVELRYEPPRPEQRIEDAVAGSILRALRETEGGVLAFLPGRSEISRTLEKLSDRVPANVDLYGLHGDLGGEEQDAAIRPSASGRRKVVLATSIAESSITIDGVRIVIDSGYARIPKFEPASGITRLETVRVSRASADQRAGRAGRTAPGIAWRLWHERQNAALPPAPAPAILEADLSGFILDCIAFGVNPEGLRMLDVPPAAALAEARRLLRTLGALDDAGRLTERGRAMRRLSVQPRLAAMIVQAAEMGAARLAAELALLISERGLGGNEIDLEQRLARIWRQRNRRGMKLSTQALRLANEVQRGPDSREVSAGRLLVLAFPDRIAQARGKRGHFRMASGRGAVLDETELLSAEPWLVVAELTGSAASARIRSAVAVKLEEIEAALDDRIEQIEHLSFDLVSKSLRRRGERRLGALVLSAFTLPPPSGEQAQTGMIKAIRTHGLDLLPWADAARSLRARIGWLHRALGEPWPDVSDEALLQELESWLFPFLPGEPQLASLTGMQVEYALQSLLPHGLQREMDEWAPSFFTAPAGNRYPIRYDGDVPSVSLRVQEVYGTRVHPTIGRGRVPLLMELLSPAGRPVQLTRNLPGFWRGSWMDVRIEMKGRYPKHFWPDRPEEAEPPRLARSQRKSR